VESVTAEDGELPCGIVATHIVGGVGFCQTQLLGLLDSLGERGAVAASIQDEIAGAI